MKLSNWVRWGASLATALVMTACGGGGGGGGGFPIVATTTTPAAANTYSFGGTVSGLAAGGNIAVSFNGASALTVSANGPYSFVPTLAANAAYSVTITQPTGQSCSVANFSGAGVTANVTNINIVCATNSYTIGGSVSGLAAGQQVTLSNNGADPLVVTADGAIRFAQGVPFNGTYSVAVDAQPSGQTCTVGNGSGAGVTANVTNVAVVCASNSFALGGMVSGLATGDQVTLENNGADPQVITANGGFNFTVPVAYNGSYAVTVGTQPVGKTCTVSNGTGAGVVAAVSNVSVACSANTFTIGGTITGLSSGQVTLLNNAGDPLTRTSNGAFTFSAPVAANGAYLVTVGTQPVGLTCSVSGGSGSGVTANVTAVTVNCSALAYTIGGAITGLDPADQVTLNNNGTDPVTVNGASPSFTFAVRVPYNGSYGVTVGTQPIGKTCSITSNGSGTNVQANVVNVSLTCSVNTFTVGGTVSGLAAGRQVTLQNNGSDDLTQAVNGSFTFATPVAYGGSYNVTVVTQPVGQTCTVTSGSGGPLSGNVSAVGVTCVTTAYRVGGTVTGLASGTPLTLRNRGGDALVVTGTGAPQPFAFATTVAAGDFYAVTPSDGKCVVDNGGGVVGAADVASVAVHCEARAAYVYAVNNKSGTVSHYAIQADGTLLPASTVSIGININPYDIYPYYLAVDSTRNFAFVNSRKSGDYRISQFTIGTTGVLTAHATVSFISLADDPIEMAMHPTAPYAYVATPNSILQFSIDSSGGLVPLTSASVLTGAGNSSGIAIDPSGRFLYVPDTDGSIRQFAIDGATGTLTAVPSNTVATGATDANEITFDPSGRFAYLTDRIGNQVFKFTVATDGRLVPLGSPIVGLDQPIRVSIDPTGRFAYVINIGKEISQFAINDATGELSAIPNAVSTGTSYGFTLDPTGSFGYSPVWNLDQIYLFGLDLSGAVSPSGQYPAAPAAPTVDEPLNLTIISAR